MRSVWFEHVREDIREFCLDQSSSELREIVDRATFARLTAASTPPTARLGRLDGMLDMITLFYYRYGGTRV
jgi:hypothetical protein